MFSNKDELVWLNVLARRWGLSDALRAQGAVFAWRRAVGPQLAAWARPTHVAGGVLHLAVFSYAAATQLRLLEPKLLEALREVAPDSGVGNLRFHIQPEGRSRAAMEEARVRPDDMAGAERWVPEDVPAGLRAVLLRVAGRARAQERAILSAGGQSCTCCGVAFLGDGTVCPVCRVVGSERDE